MLFIPFFAVAPINTFNDALLLFVGTDIPDWQEISSKYDAWAKQNVAPRNILILSCIDQAKILMSLANEEDGQERYELLRRQSEVYIGGFASNGTISVARAGENNFIGGDWQAVFQSAVESFIKAESRNESLVIAAPLGFYFSKLSNRYSSHFIRTESLLRCTLSIELLALRLLPAFSNYIDRHKSLTKIRVLLDSMVIWPVAQALTRMHRPQEELRYVIESFKSYDGINSNIVHSGQAFVLISASTSGGLEEKLIKELGSKQVEVWTLLGLKPMLDSEGDADENNSSMRNEVFALPRKLEGAPALGGLREIFEPDVAVIPPGTEAVRVIGERFLSHNVRPKLVRLAHKALDSRHKILLANLAKEGLVLAARRRLDGKAWWSISFDLNALVNKYTCGTPESPSILEHWLTNYAFPGPVLIVHPQDVELANAPDSGQNERLAKEAKRILTKTAKDESDLRVVDHMELDRPNDELRAFLDRAGVLVITPVVANGFIFKQISASLRNVKPRGPRLYISLAVLPESQARLSELKTDLESNADDSAYRFKHGLALPIGKIDETIGWQREYIILKEVKETCDASSISVPPRFAERVECFANARCLDGEHAFLPTYKGDPLPITAGFLLWTTKEPISGDTFGSIVLFTVAAFLEACREARSGANDTSLISGLFQQTLISPANFTRYNDPSIQAALLRCAYPSEINYAASTEASQDMSQLIKKLIHLHDAPSGAALGEFLLALALRRLTLERSHLIEVVNEARSLSGWLGILAAKINFP